MQQKISKGVPSRHWPYRTPTCHFCRKTVAKGEEDIYWGGDDPRHMHRVCLDNWLKAHPPLPGAISKITSAEEIEKEFLKLQRRLKAQVRKKKSSSKT